MKELYKKPETESDNENLEEHVQYKEDKIFGNNYNTGNIDFEFYSEIKINTAHESEADMFCNDEHENWEKIQLRDELYQLFKNSDFCEKYSKNKKVSKFDMMKIYYYFAKNITANKYTHVQIFTEISEFMKFNYKEMFKQLLPIDKQKIIQELNTEYNIIKKSGIKRLF